MPFLTNVLKNVIFLTNDAELSVLHEKARNTATFRHIVGSIKQ